jgi:5'-deoxynucleotidase YfbR-like HD superfamily hydrolase
MKLKKFIKRTVKEVLLEAIAFDAQEYFKGEIIPSVYKEYEKSGDMKRDLEATVKQEPKMEEKEENKKDKKEITRRRTGLRNLVRRSAKDLPTDTRRSMQQVADSLVK